MSAPVFLVPPALLDGSAPQVVLDGDEGRHAAVVRRIAAGEHVDLTDGAGRVVRCVVTSAGRDGLDCAVLERVEIAAPELRIVVAQAIPKGDRGETAVETMTEVGVDEIVPWAAQRCVVRWKGDRGAKALRRWRATAREAAKQSRRAWVPAVGDPSTTKALLDRVAVADLAIVLHEEGAVPLGGLALPSRGAIVLVVGPEGGIDDDELAAFTSAGAVVARLGPSILRTSTAGTVAAGVLSARTARWA